MIRWKEQFFAQNTPCLSGVCLVKNQKRAQVKKSRNFSDTQSEE